MYRFESGDIRKIETDLIVVFMCSGMTGSPVKEIEKLAAKLDVFSEFSGKEGELLLYYRPERKWGKRILFAGLGDAGALTKEKLRKAAGKSVRKAISLKLQDILFVIPQTGTAGINSPAAAAAVVEGALLANHDFDLYKTAEKSNRIKSFGLYSKKSADSDVIEAVRKASVVCEGTILARRWVSMPSNDKRPDRFARSIVKAADNENITIVVLDERDLKKNKMNALLCVASGSDAGPKLVLMDYRPGRYEKTVVLVGKGVTFDSGGINLKSSEGLNGMKMDMAGAAAVASIIISAARINIRKRIIGVLPLVENMPSGKATRPGDIVFASNGKSIEIGNTDAEGRLILADAMCYARKRYKPDVMIDIATLTGACMVALGEKIAGLFTKDDALAKALLDSAAEVNERCWRMPMPDDYAEKLKSDVADIKNIGKGRWGGAITGALFLSEFAGDCTWAHLDIAGPAYTDSSSDYCTPGGTGFGVRLICDFLERI